MRLLPAKKVDLTVWVEDVAESLADIIVFGAPEELQTRMLRHAIGCLKSFVEQNQQMLEEEARKKQLQ
jgi:hypothetical protein